MKISELHKNKNQSVSFEIFPPKGNIDITEFENILRELTVLSPDFISVTYSAGAVGNSDKTAYLASIIENKYNTTALAHITCINSSKNELTQVIDKMKSLNIKNVLALRGDVAEGKTVLDFKYAKDLIPLLKENDFCVGGACYPEGHIECDNVEDDLIHLKEKQDYGAEFFISQLFFKNDYFYDFANKAKQKGINVPIISGIMPILSKSQIERMIFMCGVSLPSQIVKLLNKYSQNPDDLKKAGIDYASSQIFDLLKNKVDGIHIYTMNQPQIAKVQYGLIDKYKKEEQNG